MVRMTAKKPRDGRGLGGEEMLLILPGEPRRQRLGPTHDAGRTIRRDRPGPSSAPNGKLDQFSGLRNTDGCDRWRVHAGHHRRRPKPEAVQDGRACRLLRDGCARAALTVPGTTFLMISTALS